MLRGVMATLKTVREPAPMVDAPRISVAICTRNRPAFLKAAVESAADQLAGAVELVIVDNGSTDETSSVISALKGRFPKVRSVREEAAGISNARNAALKAATGEWTLFFDDDERVPERWIASYADFLRRHQSEKVGCAGGGYEPEFDRDPPGWFDVNRARLDFGNVEKEVTGPASVWGGNVIYNRSAALAIGGFDPTLQRAEDTDLNMRLQRAGYAVWWVPNNAIIHMLPVARINLRSVMRLAFSEGRSYGRLRLAHFEGGRLQRSVYCLGRILFTPFYSIFLFALAAITLPLKRGKKAARSFQRAVRAAGIGWQMLRDLFAI
jgi:succinoglycan biosynthesis protein ExoM